MATGGEVRRREFLKTVVGVAMAPVAVVAARRAKTAVEIPSAADVEMVFGGLRTDYQSVCVMSEKTLAEISQL